MKRALVIGIDKYAVRPLNFCVADAMEVAQILQDPQYGFSVTTLINSDCTRLKMRRAIEELLAAAPEIALIYFAGHGVLTDMGGFLVTHDFQNLEDPGLSLEVLNQLVKAKASENSSVVLILDCCHSGAASLRQLENTELTDWRGPLSNDLVQRTMFRQSQRRVVLAACSAGQEAAESTREGHGIFTYHLMLGMLADAANNDGHVTPTSLYDYIAAAFTQTLPLHF